MLLVVGVFKNASATNKVREIKENWAPDTVWHVNYDYDRLSAPEFQFNLKLSKDGRPDGSTWIAVVWGYGRDTIVELQNSDQTLSSPKYPGEQTFEMSIRFYDHEPSAVTDATTLPVFFRTVFNRDLAADIVVEGAGGCMELGADTFLVHLKRPLINPPGTTYKLTFDHDELRDSICRMVEINASRDSNYVIYYGPTGMYGATYKMKMTYDEDAGTNPLYVLSGRTGTTAPVYVYKTPNLREIFTFKDSLDAETPEVKNITICAPAGTPAIAYDPIKNKKYTTKRDNWPNCAPPVWSYFSAKYYRADSVDHLVGEDRVPLDHIDWQGEIKDPEVVDTMNMIFKKAGFYKIRMTASNMCGADTLYTDSVRNVPEDAIFKKKYIQVYERGANLITLDRDNICLGASGRDTVFFTDRNKRLSWDPAPGYYYTVEEARLDGIAVEIDNPFDYMETFTRIYKNDRIVTDGAIGCDSTIFGIVFKKPGTFKGNFLRATADELNGENECAILLPGIEITVGEAPGQLLGLDTISKTLVKQNGFKLVDGRYERCDTFIYNLPDVKRMINQNNQTIDSTRWIFYSGRVLPDTMNFTAYTDAQTFMFDTTANVPMYIRTEVRNACGWGKIDSAAFYVRTQPKVQLWRDSIPANDTLCSGFDYRYYFIGTLPESYTVNATFSAPTFVDGVSVTTRPAKLGIVKHPTRIDRKEEHLVIVNDNNKACFQKIDTNLTIVGPPDHTRYEDSLRHCSSYQVLDTRELFGENPKYKWTLWTLNGDTIKDKGHFPPDCPLRDTENDTLIVKTSEATGCFVRDTLIFIPKPAPQLTLDKYPETCVTDPKQVGVNTYITGSNEGDKGVSLSVYKNKRGANPLYQTGSADNRDLDLTTADLDTVRLIYDMKNMLVDQGFGSCEHSDTVLLHVLKPKLQFTKKDTVAPPFSEYSFSRLKPYRAIDTAHLKESSISLSAIEGTGTWVEVDPTDKLYGKTYQLSNTEKATDSLIFEMSAENLCGETMIDTLVVYIPKAKIYGYKDTICSDDEAYALWTAGRVHGEFIDTATLNWRMVNVPQGKNWGHLTAATGASVSYIVGPDVAETDVVEIYVEGGYGHGGVTVHDTVFLWVNQAPVENLKDTLIVKGLDIDFTQIASAFGSIQNVSSYSGVTNKGGGTWTGDAFYSLQVQTGAFENYSETVHLRMWGNKGCTKEYSSRDITLLKVVDPKVDFKNVFEFCADDQVKLDTTYQPAKDKYTIQKWKLEGTGSFDSDTSHYTPKNGDKLTLSVYKKYTYYDGEVKTTGVSALVAPVVHVYNEPHFRLLDKNGNDYRFDTLCMGDQMFGYERAWIDANAVLANYTKEQFVTSYSEGMSGNFPEFTLADGVNRAKLIVTLDLGRCDQWKHKGDTIYITRLEQMNGSFTVPAAICEGGVFMITDVIPDALCAGYSWEASGGSLNTADLSAPIFTSEEAGEGSVTMRVFSPAGCTDTADYTTTFTMEEKPSLVLEDAVFCYGMNFDIPFTRHANVGKIEWKANGRIFATTTTEEVVQYTFNPADVVAGKILIAGVITPDGFCTDQISSNEMIVTLQNAPSITGSLTGTVCQGGELELGASIVDAADYNTLAWTASAGVMADDDVLHTFYQPGDNNGLQTLTLTATGLHGCPDVQKNIAVTVKDAPLPSFTVVGPACAGGEVKFVNNSSDVNRQSWKWEISSGASSAGQWYEYAHRFVEAGDSTVSLTINYNNGCSQKSEQTFTIHALPQVDFRIGATGDSIVGVGKEVSFIDLTPGTVAAHSWDFNGLGTMVKDENGVYVHRFDAISGTHQFAAATLKITSNEGCEASKTKGLKIVASPQAKFEISEFDHCTGDTEFKNLSAGENLSYRWDLGYQGWESADAVPAGITYAPEFKDSTYYIRLTASNVAGEHTWIDSVKVVSKLKADFVISPEDAGCTGQLERKVYNRAQGRADQYIFDWNDGTPPAVMTEYNPNSIGHLFRNESDRVQYYRIKLTASNVCNEDTIGKTLSVYPTVAVPLISADVSRGCYPLEVTFTNQSAGFGPDAQIWWYFGEGSSPVTGTTNQIRHTFDTPGTYVVKMAIKDRCNSDTTADGLNVQALGDNSLAFAVENDPVCSGRDIRMRILPELKGRYADPVWEFGNGLIAHGGDTVATRYNTAGNYTVKLIAKSTQEMACPTTIYKTLTVNRTPAALIDPADIAPGCQPYPINFKSGFTEAGDQIYWDFKNGSTSTDAVVPGVLYKDYGKYRVLLRVTSPEGCVDTSGRLVVVNETPVPSFNVLDSLFCTEDGKITVGLDNTSEKMDQNTYKWTYMGNTFAIDEQPVKYSPQPVFGDLELRLIATNKENGCQKEYVKRVRSSHKVAVTIQMDNSPICNESPIRFRSKSIYGDAVEWDLGDGSIVSDTNFTYEYEKAGEYIVRLRANNTDGCVDSVIKNITVYPLPVADFVWVKDNRITGLPDTLTLPDVDNGGIRFDNLSYVNPETWGNKLKHQWNFGDDSTSVSSSPTHRYRTNGVYEVVLWVSTEHNCRDSFADIVKVSTVKGLYIPTAFAPAMEDDGMRLFKPAGIGLHSYKIQIFDKWGTCVWNSEKLNEGGRPAEGWDGTFKGEGLPKDTYYWKVSGIFLDGSVWDNDGRGTQGGVMLIR